MSVFVERLVSVLIAALVGGVAVHWFQGTPLYEPLLLAAGTLAGLPLTSPLRALSGPPPCPRHSCTLPPPPESHT
jgi:hypothetical protein